MRQKVLFAINDFTFGGAQKLYADLFDALDHGKFEVHLLTLFELPNRRNMYGLVNSQVTVHRLNFSGFTDVSSWLGLLELLRRIRPRVVVSSLFFSNTALRLAKVLLGFKVYACEHNTYIGKPKLQQLIDRALSHLSPCVVAVSASVASFTSRQEGIPLEKFKVIRNGINLQPIDVYRASHGREATRARLGFSPHERVAISVGRLTAQKNQQLLVRAFAEFSASHPGQRLVVLGEGSLRSELDALVAELGCGDRVQLLGARHDIYDFYLAADYLVSTSTIEGLSIAYAEALAFGLPLLATRTAGTDEMINEGMNGYFIAQPTVESAVAGLGRLAAADLAALSRGAAEAARGFGIEGCAAAYAELLEG